VNIRPINEEDFMDCINIIKKSWPEFKERESLYHIFSKYFHNTSFICEDDGKVVSFLLGFFSQVDDVTSYIHLVSTEPSHQRRGIASMLYRHFFETACKKGRRKVCLTVSPDNIPSLKFHEKLGFHINNVGPVVMVGNITAAKDYNGPGNHRVMFSMELS
jgi:ribosomal protein S18 acetylase RimI-like enzyme